MVAALAVLLASAPALGRGRVLEAIGIRAVDGDSILVELPDRRQEEVRLLLVDAPEHGQAFAEEAKRFLNGLVAGRRLRLTTQVEERDRYGRLLALVEADGRLVNRELVGHGLALALVIPPNIERVDELLSALEDAHRGRLGIWGEPGLPEEPRSFRARKRGETTVAQPLRFESWLVVGNAKSSVAHWPGCRHVNDIAPGNRRPFPSTAAARAAGYRMEKGYD